MMYFFILKIIPGGGLPVAGCYIIIIFCCFRYSSPESIRGRFGLTDTRNSSHGSDSTENASQGNKHFNVPWDHNINNIEEK